MSRDQVRTESLWERLVVVAVMVEMAGVEMADGSGEDGGGALEQKHGGSRAVHTDQPSKTYLDFG